MKIRQLTIWFLAAVIAVTSGIFLLTVSQPALAQSDDNGAGDKDPCVIRDFEKAAKVQIAIPGVTQKNAQDGGHYVADMACYISGIYRYFASVAGILAVVMIMYGGIKRVVSFGNPQKISDANDTVVSAMLGLALTLVSYVILSFINPNLVSLKVPGIKSIDPFPDAICDDRASFKSYQNDEKSVIERQCGNIGKFNERECIFMNCPPGDIKLKDVWDDGRRVCALGDANDPDHHSDTWQCMHPRDRCQRVDDENNAIGPGVHPEACGPLTIAGRGKCVWVDEHFWLMDFLPYFGEKVRDRCVWLPELRCIGDWQRADCSECIANNVTCDPLWMKIAGYFQIDDIYQYLKDRDIKVGTNVVCEADKDEPVYFSTPASSGDGDHKGICCKLGNEYSCHAYYWEGD